MNKFNTIKEIIESRHSWREYQPEKITKEDINDVLETTRHCPSAFGSEPWHLVVVGNNNVIKDLYPHIWSQPQVLKASHLFLILAYKADVFKLNSPELTSRYKTRYNNNDDVFNKLQNGLINYLKKNITDIEEWAKRQCYILLDNLILTCFSKGIGTSPMEGFTGPHIINYLEVNNYIPKNKFNVAVVVAAGYLPAHASLPFTSKFLTVEELVTNID